MSAIGLETRRTQPSTRPIGGGLLGAGLIDPAPLALGAFALSTFVLSWVNTGLADRSAIVGAVATAWFMGGVVQLLVGMWEVHHGRLFAAVTFGSYGAFWLGFAIFETLYASRIPAAHAEQATALFLAPWIVFSVYMLIGSLATNRALTLAFALVVGTLVVLVVGFANGSAGTIKAGGWVGVALAVEVWYVAAAEVINHQFGRTLLPLGERN